MNYFLLQIFKPTNIIKILISWSQKNGINIIKLQIKNRTQILPINVINNANFSSHHSIIIYKIFSTIHFFIFFSENLT